MMDARSLIDASEPLIIVAGGPGSGKTTLLGALAARGIAISPEAGRAIIRDQVAIDGTGLPWADGASLGERRGVRGHGRRTDRCNATFGVRLRVDTPEPGHHKSGRACRPSRK